MAEYEREKRRGLLQPGYEKKRSSVQSEIKVLRHELGKQGDLDNETKRIRTQHTGLHSFSFEDFDQFQQIHPQTDAYATRETEELRDNYPIQANGIERDKLLSEESTTVLLFVPLPRIFLEEDRD